MASVRDLKKLQGKMEAEAARAAEQRALIERRMREELERLEAEAKATQAALAASLRETKGARAEEIADLVKDFVLKREADFLGDPATGRAPVSNDAVIGALGALLDADADAIAALEAQAPMFRSKRGRKPGKAGGIAAVADAAVGPVSEADVAAETAGPVDAPATEVEGTVIEAEEASAVSPTAESVTAESEATESVITESVAAESAAVDEVATPVAETPAETSKRWSWN